MMDAVHAGTSPVRAGLTELGMLGYSSAMAAESADIVSELTDSELAGMVAGTIVGIGSYGGLKSLDQSVNISGLYPLKETPNSYAELMAPEEAEWYLKFLEKGSTEGLTDAELEAIRKVDEALALKKADGQSVLMLDICGLKMDNNYISIGAAGEYMRREYEKLWYIFCPMIIICS